jgi:hypothetical protein
MRKLLALAGVAAAVAGFGATAARADPLNQLSLPLTFSCDNGLDYVGVAISVNHSFTGHVYIPASNAVFIVAQESVGGTVVPMRGGLPDGIPGLAGRTNLFDCTLEYAGTEFVGDQDIVVRGFFTPNT